jgi:nifR3 family TIM-barrel protein
VYDVVMRIGPIQLATPFCQAGLAGYSDRAMRMVARRRGCPYAVTEALLDVILLSGGQGLRNCIDIADEDHPVAGQIIGSEPESMAKAAKILHEFQYDVIDLNFACPVKKIKNKARGGHMLRDLERGKAIVRAVRDAVPEAVLTVSLRRGFDDSAESTDQFWELLEFIFDNGCAAARVHARTVEQKYLGKSRWEFLKQVKERFPHRTILGSGDVFTAEDAVRMLKETGVDIVWIARGAIGNPWIFEHARLLLENPQIELQPPMIHQQKHALFAHFQIAGQIHGEALAGRRMRKQGIKYARFHPRAAEVKEAFIRVSSMRDWMAVLDQFYDQDGPGIWPSPTAVDEVNASAEMQSCEAQ